MGADEAELIKRLRDDKKLSYFPNLASTAFEKTSEYDESYNCFAWAVGWTHCRIDPGPPRVGDYWPKNVQRGTSVRSSVEALNAEGFNVCESGDYEHGFIMIALYADKRGSAKHAARLREDGRWSSKLGDWDDIAHCDLNAVGGADYGTAVRFLKKANPSPEPIAGSPLSEPTQIEPEGSGSTP